MKKFIVSILVVLVIIVFNKDKIVIPKESIRIRVIPNSNSVEDQEVKREVKEEIYKKMNDIVGDARNINEARKNIVSNINMVDNIVSSKVSNYEINYGINNFPSKEYKGVKYEEGDYESLVITLGEGKGDNWWCVLFPPFCLVEAEENDEIEYKFKIMEIIQRYF